MPSSEPPASKIAPQTAPIKSPRSALREISTIVNATRLGQSVLQVLSKEARYPLAAKTTIVATRLIHLRSVVLLDMLIKSVRIFKFVEFPAVAPFLVT